MVAPRFLTQRQRLSPARSFTLQPESLKSTIMLQVIASLSNHISPRRLALIAGASLLLMAVRKRS